MIKDNNLFIFSFFSSSFSSSASSLSFSSDMLSSEAEISQHMKMPTKGIREWSLFTAGGWGSANRRGQKFECKEVEGAKFQCKWQHRLSLTFDTVFNVPVLLNLLTL